MQQLQDRIEELRTLREWLTASDDVETAEDIAELLSGLGYSEEARDLMAIARGQAFGEQPNAYRLKEMHRIVDTVVRNGDARKAKSRATSASALPAKPMHRNAAAERRALRIEWIGYLIFFVLGFLAGRYFS